MSNLQDLSVALTTDVIKLDALLKLAGVVGSGGHAKQLIQERLVRVNGATETRRGKKIRRGDVVDVRRQWGVRISVR